MAATSARSPVRTQSRQGRAGASSLPSRKIPRYKLAADRSPLASYQGFRRLFVPKPAHQRAAERAAESAAEILAWWQGAAGECHHSRPCPENPAPQDPGAQDGRDQGIRSFCAQALRRPAKSRHGSTARPSGGAFACYCAWRLPCRKRSKEVAIHGHHQTPNNRASVSQASSGEESRQLQYCQTRLQGPEHKSRWRIKTYFNRAIPVTLQTSSKGVQTRTNNRCPGSCAASCQAPAFPLHCMQNYFTSNIPHPLLAEILWRWALQVHSGAGQSGGWAPQGVSGAGHFGETLRL